MNDDVAKCVGRTPFSIMAVLCTKCERLTPDNQPGYYIYPEYQAGKCENQIPKEKND